jgi:hypothetical protein
MNNYNMLIHYADFRKDVVSDIPDDIYLDELELDDEQKELILNGLPLVKDFVISIYDNIIEYAGNPSLPRKEISEYKNSGELMNDRRDARNYIDKVFLSLYSIISDGIYDSDCTVIVSKEYLKRLAWHRIGKFQQSQLQHLEYFCLFEYYKDNELSDWRRCESVSMIFEDRALCYTLRHMIKNKINPLYFKYGDFRVYSKSGQTEDIQDRFPESVRLKALGKEKYKLYQTLCNITDETLNIKQTGENTYQGHGHFMILCDYGDIVKYKPAYKNTRIGLCITKDKLTVDLRLGFEAFGKLPEIIEKLSPNARNAFLTLGICNPSCTHRCTSKRFAVFDEKIYPNKILKP